MKLTDKRLKAASLLEDKAVEGVTLNRRQKRFLAAANKKAGG